MEQKIQDPVRFSASSLDCIKAEEGAFLYLEKPLIFGAPDDFQGSVSVQNHGPPFIYFFAFHLA